VNGKHYEATVEPRMTLVDMLRVELGLVGTHVGCEHGVCGACTILFDGQAARSCIMLAVQADGGELMTIEGLHHDGELHPIQQAFIDGHGLQCGFCTPGFIMTVYELLANNPSPSDERIYDALGGNICRCTGYESIIRSVKIAAEKMQELSPQSYAPP
jgi:aerobic-type carbon monoxide dehydrogenase small subunit (CoxS/CutS family)